MADEKSTPESNSDTTIEIESTTPDYMRTDSVASEPTHHPPMLMPNLHPDEELSDNRISELMVQFLSEFIERYPTSGPPLYMGSLDQALINSLYNQNDVRPLILFIYHGLSVNTNVFCQTVLCQDKITNYISEKFIVWAWDRTNNINYQRLLEMLDKHLGNQIKETVASSSVDTFPMLICLTYNNGQVEITNIIQGYVSHDLTLDLLKEAHDRFNCRIETPHSAKPLWQPVTNEVWSMSPSVLKSIEKTSEEFERIADEYIGQTKHVTQIDKIENSSWLSQYLDEEKAIRSYRIENQIEQTLVFPCSQVTAQHILENGFNNDHKVRTYRHGFHFQSPVTYKKRDLPSNSANDSPQAMLVCRVLVGRTCHKDRMMETSPTEYDSTTDGLETYIVNSNRRILPIYYIKY